MNLGTALIFIHYGIVVQDCADKSGNYRDQGRRRYPGLNIFFCSHDHRKRLPLGYGNRVILGHE